MLSLKPTLAVVLTAGMLTASSAHALVVSQTDAVFDAVDNAFDTKVLNFGAADFAGGSSIVSGVTVTVDFSKCGSSVNAAGCTGGGTSFANEIGLALRSPGGTNVSLVENDSDNELFETGAFETYVFSSPTLSRIVITFDDTGLALGSVPVSGTFAPEGLLSDFIGENAIGAWTFFYEDDVGADPLGIHSVTVAIETEGEGRVPVPGALALLGLGLVGLGYHHRRRRES